MPRVDFLGVLPFLVIFLSSIVLGLMFTVIATQIIPWNVPLLVGGIGFLSTIPIWSLLCLYSGLMRNILLDIKDFIFLLYNKMTLHTETLNDERLNTNEILNDERYNNETLNAETLNAEIYTNEILNDERYNNMNEIEIESEIAEQFAQSTVNLWYDII